MTSVVAGGPSPISTLPNLRDLGGYSAADGQTVRTGLLYRSTDFSSLSHDDLAPLEGLGIRTVYDLRSVAERTALPDPRMPDVVEVPLDVLADAEQAIPANIGKFLGDAATVKFVTENLTADKGVELIAGTYRELVTLPSALAAYQSFFEGLAGAHSTPALFHCTTGKDRTGWAAASFLTLMGVDRDAVYHDYLLTNERLIPALKPLFDEFAAAGGDPALLRPVLGVDAHYLDAAFDEMTSRYGDITGYFAGGLGIDEAGQQKLRENFLQAG